ncbi:hypothetical protein HAHE_37730 [Haloferula helveola]|uniref:Peptidase S14 n=1 Tax=Haloferula helveola TaxID=490095 RepID=A0ABM7RGX0_9BACT|nr:hypothetical protein HAHE_37730 [Haloferula helveola]
MKTTVTRSALLGLALAGTLCAQQNSASPSAATTPPVEIKVEKKADEKKPAKKAPKSAEAPKKEAKTDKPAPKKNREEQMKEEQARLALENALADERVKKETAKLRSEVARLKAEKELIAERMSFAAMKRKADDEAQAAKMEVEAARLAREANIAKARAEMLTNELKAVQAESGIEITKLQNQIQEFEMAEKRKTYADAKPEYLKKPLKADGTLVISDRRIALNGAISGSTADYITDRIHYFNNQNREHPIFIVIDESPGGSVMAGYRILKAMEASDAPIHVVVKSFAASMAAAITTLAEESYCYPNAVMLHHQISATVFGRLNLTQQEEFLKESQRWWERLATPIADKMGITKEEFIKKMYAQSTSGDWSEFGVEAQKLKWVNHIVQGIDETSFLRSPDAARSAPAATPTASVQTGPPVMEATLDEDGRPVMYLPRINPKDVYFIYNPDGYYRLR